MRATSTLLFAVLIVEGGCRTTPDASSSPTPSSTHAVATSSVGTARDATPAPDPTPLPSARAFSLDPTADLERLPAVTPAACSEGGKDAFTPMPRSAWKPVLDAVVSAWPEGSYPPRHCVRSIRARCAPDLDGEPGAEVLVEVAFLVAVEGVLETEQPLTPPCSSRARAYHAPIVALSPPPRPGAGWSFRGIVGYARHGTGEQGLELTIKRFVRLPNGATGVYAHAVQPGFTAQYDLVIASDGSPEWRNVASRHFPQPEAH